MITQVSPSLVGVGESHSLVIIGEGFRKRQGISCVLTGPQGIQILQATHIDHQTIVCYSTMFGIPQSIVVQASNNGQIYEDINALTIQVVPPLVIDDVFPKSAVVGGSVHLTGFNFVSSEPIYCMVGGILAHSVVVKAESSAICHLSQDNIPEDIAGVQLSLNGFSYSKVTSNTQIAIRGRPSITEVLPSIALVWGGSRILVKGANFHGFHTVSCQFGGGLSSKAEVLSPAKLTCLSPHSHAQTVTFRVVVDGVWSYDNIYFQFFDPIVLRSIFPSLGSIAGGTPISVVADNLDPTLDPPPLSPFESDLESP